MEIRVSIDTRKCWSLLIDGKNPLNVFQQHKPYIKGYLKKHYGIDLLTDKNIVRNYTEYRTNKLVRINSKTLLVKQKRDLI